MIVQSSTCSPSGSGHVRFMTILAVLAALICGCAGDPSAPCIPSDQQSQMGPSHVGKAGEMSGPHQLCGQWTFFFDETHTKVEAVPVRSARLHLNALKFLEEYCKDCLEITGIHKNGDGTVDMTVLITHPFPDNPEYTGFDVKGIIMFNGTHTVPWWSQDIFPYGEVDVDLHYFYISWAELGDPELLNQDGYTVRWSPWWDSGSDLPIFNYWQGKYAKGTPTANINAFKNFYTDEQRHMFRVTGSVQREYHMFLPPGPVVAGYAVEACWEPPTVTPVTDPLNDFPVSANQEEPYYFRFIVNNDQPVTEKVISFDYWLDCSYTRYEWSQWHGHIPGKGDESWPFPPDIWAITAQTIGLECDQEPPPNVKSSFTGTIYPLYDLFDGKSGNYRGVAVCFAFYNVGGDLITSSIAYDVFDFTLDY